MTQPRSTGFSKQTISSLIISGTVFSQPVLKEFGKVNTINTTASIKITFTAEGKVGSVKVTSKNQDEDCKCSESMIESIEKAVKKQIKSLKVELEGGSATVVYPLLIKAPSE